MALDDLDGDFARRLIRYKARRMIGRAGLTAQDRDDLEQELLLHLLEALPRFDPDRGHSDTFSTAVIEHAAAELLRKRSARKRNGNVVQPPDGFEPLDPRDTERDIDRLDLAADVAEVLTTLPAGLRDLAERLMRQSVAAAARDQRVPRSTFQRTVQQLRRRFESAGLTDYL